jgi:hypothetical protein
VSRVCFLFMFIFWIEEALRFRLVWDKPRHPSRGIINLGIFIYKVGGGEYWSSG